jgi:hypothetical protein
MTDPLLDDVKALLDEDFGDDKFVEHVKIMKLSVIMKETMYDN